MPFEHPLPTTPETELTPIQIQSLAVLLDSCTSEDEVARIVAGFEIQKSPDRTLDEIYDILRDGQSTEQLTAVDAAEILTNGLPSVLVDFIGRFSSINLTNLAVKLMDMDEHELVVDNLEVFQGDAVNGLLLSLLETDDRKYILELLLPDTPLPGKYIQDFEFTPGDALYFLDCFYDIPKDTLQWVREYTNREWLIEYPRNARSLRQKDHWYGDVLSDYIAPGFNRDIIGRFAREQIESSAGRVVMVDITVWLETLDPPEEAVNIKELLVEREWEEYSEEDVASDILFDWDVEEEFFAAVLVADVELRQRLLLSSKPDAVHRYFDYQTHYLLYQVLTSKDDSGTELYKCPDLTLDSLFAAADEQLEDLVLLTRLDRHSSIETLQQTQNSLKDAKENIGVHLAELGSSPKVSELLGELKMMGQQREKYLRDAEGWLLRHSKQRFNAVTRAWEHRPVALLDPTVSDTANDINIEKKVSLLREFVLLPEVDEYLKGINVTVKELMSEEGLCDFRELARHYDVKSAMSALIFLYSNLHERGWDITEKYLPEGAVRIGVVHEAETAWYRFETLGPDDARSFTIGPDTGCCMRLGGEAELCIAVGLDLKNAGFMALYDENNRDKLIAQSFWYVHPDHADTLVIDSIETTEGRDLNAIMGLYIKSLHISLKYATHPITKVNIGLCDGYEVLLPVAEVIVPPLEDVYSDAREYQWRLLDIDS